MSEKKETTAPTPRVTMQVLKGGSVSLPAPPPANAEPEAQGKPEPKK